MQGQTEHSAEAALRSIHPCIRPPTSPSSIHLPPGFSLTPSLPAFLPSFTHLRSASVLPSAHTTSVRPSAHLSISHSGATPHLALHPSFFSSFHHFPILHPLPNGHPSIQQRSTDHPRCQGAGGQPRACSVHWASWRGGRRFRGFDGAKCCRGNKTEPWGRESPGSPRGPLITHASIVSPEPMEK